jgi:hypothetical protein
LSEAVAEVVSKDSRQEQVAALRTEAVGRLRDPLITLLRYTYDPRITWLLSKGVPEFKRIEIFDTEGMFAAETRRFYLYVQGGEKPSPYAPHPVNDFTSARAEYNEWVQDYQNRGAMVPTSVDGVVRADCDIKYRDQIMQMAQYGKIDPRYLPFEVNTEQAQGYWVERVRTKKRLRMERSFLDTLMRLQPSDAMLFIQVKDRQITGLSPDAVLEAFPGLWEPAP